MVMYSILQRPSELIESDDDIIETSSGKTAISITKLSSLSGFLLSHTKFHHLLRYHQATPMV